MRDQRRASRSIHLPSLGRRLSPNTRRIPSSLSPMMCCMWANGACPRGQKLFNSGREPTNGFDFEAENAFISVVGSVTLNLKGGRRRLADGAGSANRDLQAAAADEDIASFELSVSLEPKESSVGDGFVVTASSVKDGPGHEGLAVLATLLASALVFIW